ncbi:hypothetical protein AB0J35_57960 [Nonomuraea angiospora]|uniref:hypothetical protein n=1 Tax=Nonomuraea angiospora TaxID=46172 RepID=UPI003434B9E9
MAPRTWVAPPDNTLWQRRAVTVLASILYAHSHLSPLRWTVAPIGCGLTAEVTDPDPYLAERAFAEWQSALRLELAEHDGTRLRAVSRAGAVCRITVTAALSRTRKDPNA